MKVDRERREDFLVFGSPTIGEEEIEEVVATLRSGWLGFGPKTKRFEALFGQYVGSRYALAMNSGTAALHLALIAARVGPGDEVITTPMTFCSTANVIVHVGAKPVFVDIDRETMNIDPALIEPATTSRTKAVIPVHLAGRPCEMDAIMAVAERHGLVVIEDAAHAVGAEYGARRVGNIGHMTAFSFYVTKNLMTGEGGMLTTNGTEWAEKVDVLRLHGISKDAWKRYSASSYQHYETIYPGYKYNMTDLQASLGIHQLARIERWLARREEVWRRYDAAFKGLPVVTPPAARPGTRHARHLYTILVDRDTAGCSRDDVLERLRGENIGAGVHFVSLHLQAYYRESFGYKEDEFPNARYVSERTLSLPLSPKLSDEDVEDVISAVRRVLTR